MDEMLGVLSFGIGKVLAIVAVGGLVFMIAHACGYRHARELKRAHVRIVQSAELRIALNTL